MFHISSSFSTKLMNLTHYWTFHFEHFTHSYFISTQTLVFITWVKIFPQDWLIVSQVSSENWWTCTEVSTSGISSRIIISLITSFTDIPITSHAQHGFSCETVDPRNLSREVIRADKSKSLLRTSLKGLGSLDWSSVCSAKPVSSCVCNRPKNRFEQQRVTAVFLR